MPPSLGVNVNNFVYYEMMNKTTKVEYLKVNYVNKITLHCMSCPTDTRIISNRQRN